MRYRWATASSGCPTRYGPQLRAPTAELRRLFRGIAVPTWTTTNPTGTDIPLHRRPKHVTFAEPVNDMAFAGAWSSNDTFAEPASSKAFVKALSPNDNETNSDHTNQLFSSSADDDQRIVIRESLDEPTWKVVWKTKPTRAALSSSGADKIFRRLLDVVMAKSARRAITGDGVCIGLTYNGNAFVHRKASRNKDLTREIVAEVKSR